MVDYPLTDEDFDIDDISVEPLEFDWDTDEGVLTIDDDDDDDDWPRLRTPPPAYSPPPPYEEAINLRDAPEAEGPAVQPASPPPIEVTDEDELPDIDDEEPTNVELFDPAIGSAWEPIEGEWRFKVSWRRVTDRNALAYGCPFCLRAFRTRYGLRGHFSRAHLLMDGARAVPNVRCPRCASCGRCGEH